MTGTISNMLDEIRQGDYSSFNNMEDAIAWLLELVDEYESILVDVANEDNIDIHNEE